MIMRTWRAKALEHNADSYRDSPNMAVVEPAAQAVLEQFDIVVDHYDVVISAA